MKKYLNGNLVEVTGLEKTEIENQQSTFKTEKQILKTEEANKETKKASGKQKLKDLGLDDDEIQALIGV
jgi:hypothetical protein